MLVKLRISDKTVEAFKENLGNYNTHPEIIKAVIVRYLEDSANQDNIDLAAAQYLDSLEESGELFDIVEQVTTK